MYFSLNICSLQVLLGQRAARVRICVEVNENPTLSLAYTDHKKLSDLIGLRNIMFTGTQRGGTK
jgi:hypothetical protein